MQKIGDGWRNGAGYLVRIDWSQTDHDTILVKGSKTREEAIAVVKKGCNCPRIYIAGYVDEIKENE